MVHQVTCHRIPSQSPKVSASISRHKLGTSNLQLTEISSMTDDFDVMHSVRSSSSRDLSDMDNNMYSTFCQPSHEMDWKKNSGMLDIALTCSRPSKCGKQLSSMAESLPLSFSLDDLIATLEESFKIAYNDKDRDDCSSVDSIDLAKTRMKISRR
jgi:hypothetical protein